MQSLSEAIEGAAEFSDFMKKATADREELMKEVEYQSGKRPGENREMYRARMKQLRRSTVK
jgi:hypothetical protein